jgi:hypothetical protein
MIEDGSSQPQIASAKPLGVTTSLATITREIHRLWHDRLLDPDKAPGWGCEFDRESDMLFGQAGDILVAQGGGVNDDAYRFCIAYGRMSMGLRYGAYHAVDAIIITFRAINPGKESPVPP